MGERLTAPLKMELREQRRAGKVITSLQIQACYITKPCGHRHGLDFKLANFVLVECSLL